MTFTVILLPVRIFLGGAVLYSSCMVFDLLLMTRERMSWEPMSICLRSARPFIALAVRFSFEEAPVLGRLLGGASSKVV